MHGEGFGSVKKRLNKLRDKRYEETHEEKRWGKKRQLYLPYRENVAAD